MRVTTVVAVINVIIASVVLDVVVSNFTVKCHVLCSGFISFIICPHTNVDNK